MSEQTEPTSGESGSLNAAKNAEVGSEPMAVEPAMVTASETNASETDASEAPKAEPSAPASQAQASRPEISQTSGKEQAPGKVIIMSRGDRAWADNDVSSGPEDATRHSIFGNRRMAAMAAVVALATAVGAVGGSLATSAVMRDGATGDIAANSSPPSLEASLSRIDSDIQALKSGLEHTSKLGMNQFNKTSERLDKLERAQAEPAGKLAKLSEAVDKLRTAPAVAAASAVPKETTGSISAVSAPPAAAQQAAATPPKPEAGRLPTLDGWILRDVAQGGALIDGRRGIYEVYAGDFIPGLGRIDAIRRQDGRWVVVTSRGLIVAR